MSQLRLSLDDLYEKGELGDWFFDEGDVNIYIRLPDGGHDGSVTNILLAVPGVRGWQWDGNREAPTLTPSINWVGKWHGYMTSGKLVTA